MSEKESDNLAAGFRATGLIPLNADAVLKRLPQARIEPERMSGLVGEAFFDFLAPPNKGDEVSRRRRLVPVSYGEGVTAAEATSLLEARNPRPKIVLKLRKDASEGVWKTNLGLTENLKNSEADNIERETSEVDTTFETSDMEENITTSSAWNLRKNRAVVASTTEGPSPSQQVGRGDISVARSTGSPSGRNYDVAKNYTADELDDMPLRLRLLIKKMKSSEESSEAPLPPASGEEVSSVNCDRTTDITHTSDSDLRSDVMDSTLNNGADTTQNKDVGRLLTEDELDAIDLKIQESSRKNKEKLEKLDEDIKKIREAKARDDTLRKDNLMKKQKIREKLTMEMIKDMYNRFGKSHCESVIEASSSSCL